MSLNAIYSQTKCEQSEELHPRRFPRVWTPTKKSDPGELINQNHVDSEPGHGSDTASS